MQANSYVLVLHDIRSAQNVGSLFRSSDALGVSKIYLSNITPCPVDRFGRDRSDIAKTALGAEKNIPWEQYQDIFELIKDLKSQGFSIVGIEQAEGSVDYKSFQKSEKIVFVLGNEVEGLSKEILKHMDTIIEIPMRGQIESLNVSVAGPVAMFRILDN